MPLDRIYLADENGIASPAHPTALFIQRFLELAVVYSFQTSKYAMESTKRAISIEIANGKKYNKLFIGRLYLFAWTGTIRFVFPP